MGMILLLHMDNVLQTYFCLPTCIASHFLSVTPPLLLVNGNMLGFLPLLLSVAVYLMVKVCVSKPVGKIMAGKELLKVQNFGDDFTYAIATSTFPLSVNF